MEDTSKWLKEHQLELDREEIISEEEKQFYAFHINWPTPKLLPNLREFSQIVTSDGFNHVVGSPANWQTIRENSELLNEWVLPHAILLFGKTWFDRVKWSPSIVMGGKFPLFSNFDKDYAKKNNMPLEQTAVGKSKISQIIERVAYALNIYLKGEWYFGDIKPPSGYIIESIKNEMVRNIADENGYKIIHSPACPFCLSKGRKTPVQRHSNVEVSCNACQELYKNIKLNINKYINEGKFNNVKELYLKLVSIERFLNFSPLIAICPKCEKHTPASCLDCSYSRTEIDFIKNQLLNVKVPRTSQTTINVPNSIKNIRLHCPYCNYKFIPKLLSGLPSVNTWYKPEQSIDECVINGLELKNVLAESSMNFVQEQINNNQRIGILIDELFIKLSSMGVSSINSLATWYFYLAVTIWMKNNPNDAVAYFFKFENEEQGPAKKKISVPFGQEVSIHQAIFYLWVKLLDDNIYKFRQLNSSFVGFHSFSWLASPPKFSDGPMSTFISTVTSNGITNKSEVYEIGSSAKPRIVKVISIYKIDNEMFDCYNFIKDIKSVEWQNIRLKKDTKLRIGDRVCVSVILMSGHPTHAPIQRILRLRKKVFQPIIDKILLEEKGCIFQEFWLHRNKLVKEAYNKLGSLKEIGVDKYGS